MDVRALVWDYDLSPEEFLRILRGEITHGRLDADWAAHRVLEYAPYTDLVELIGYANIVKHWPRWRVTVRSESRRRGLDFLVAWLPSHRHDLMEA